MKYVYSFISVVWSIVYLFDFFQTGTSDYGALLIAVLLIIAAEVSHIGDSLKRLSSNKFCDKLPGKEYKDE